MANSNSAMRLEVLHNIVEESKHQNYCFCGNSAYYKLDNGNNIKVTCRDSDLLVEVINRTGGRVDAPVLPFSCYFAAVQCSPGAPLWYPCIDGNNWRFCQYSHCLPTRDDFWAIADALDDVIYLYS